MSGTAPSLYNRTFILGFFYNLMMGLNFTNNAVYPLYVKDMGGTAETIGYFMSILGISAVLGRPVIGWLIDRIGTKRIMFLGSFATAVASIGYWLLLDQGLVAWVWLLRILHGLGLGTHFSAFLTMAAQVAPPGRRTESIAMFSLSGSAANFIGPAVGEYVHANFGLGPFFLMVSAFGFIASALALMMNLPAKHHQPGSGPTLQGCISLLKSKKLTVVFILAFLLTIGYYTPSYFLAPFSKERGLATFGIFFSGYAVGGVLIRLIGRTWVDRLGIRRVLLPTFTLYGFAMLMITLSHTPTILVIAGFMNGASQGLGYPAINSFAYTRAPSLYAGSVMSLVTGIMDISSLCAAICFGIFANHYGFAPIFYFAAAAEWSAVIILLVLVLRNPAKMVRK